MSQEQQQKRKAVVITAQQFTSLLNHFLINVGTFVQTSLVEEAKAEGAPATQNLTVVLGNQVPARSEVMGILNTYCEQVTLIANKELGIVAQCQVLLGENSTVAEPEQGGAPDLEDLGAPVSENESDAPEDEVAG